MFCAAQDSELRVRRAEPSVTAVNTAAEPRNPEASGSPDCSSDASFVTAVEDSPQPWRPVGAWEEAPSCQLQALKLTTEGDGDLRPSHPHGLVAPMSDLQLLQALRALGHSPGPVTPFTRGHYLRRLQEAQASPGEFLGGIWSLATLPESCGPGCKTQHLHQPSSSALTQFLFPSYCRTQSRTVGGPEDGPCPRLQGG